MSFYAAFLMNRRLGFSRIVGFGMGGEEDNVLSFKLDIQQIQPCFALSQECCLETEGSLATLSVAVLERLRYCWVFWTRY